MPTKNKIILLFIALILIIPIIINEVNLRPKLALIKDVEEITKQIEAYNYKGETVEVLISDKYVLNDKTYQIEGNGVIFLEDNYSVMLSRNGMCAMKMPYSDEIMFQEEACPNYRLVNGEKIVVE